VLEIPFRGTGWIYLGEQESRPGIAYTSRYVEKEGQTFLFQTELPGTYTLSFYKQDFIADAIVNDAVQVIVNPVPKAPERSGPSTAAEPGRVIAEPRWPPLPREAAQDSKAGPSVQLPLTELPLAAIPPPELPPAPVQVDYLQQAREAYSAGQFPQVIASLDQFREQYPAGTDEAWWLYAQSLEAPGPSRDIRAALEYYQRLIREYPQSIRGNDARRRIAYLERYYFTIQ
jgi:TolA-binding protein